ncbi:PQQ-binding-like beta-propeller repeat protein [Bacillus sp. ISL-40]|uniref:outer membrane protein assembly factor BamB family protein n=1 Tax=unclassified Bacillus (in: firmicutes) TaxID=185979 RepID=UPI001BE741C2|nr:MULTISPECIES: PQQ-binding-like beta-propeller repeat protein [unclassified Bacillus (in: firmicutes)]MBT2699549.1 PQQ-binding-like beta-propeller repeat protein [Bacillus sp. ISL-40]MBT2741169.1 PQQ-binding-like beta-propeller repeat protein [Bacillus sp. ISL-77]
MMYFNHYYRNNPYNTYVPISELSRVGAKVTWDEKQKVFRVTSDYHLLKVENQQLRQRITELTALVTNRGLRANDQNWEMHLADQGNTNYSTATMPVDLTLLSLKKDPFNNASKLFSVNQNQLYSAERISKKILSATDLDTYKERWNFSTEDENGFLDLIARDGVVYASTMTNIYAIQDNGTSPLTLWTVDSFANRLILDRNTLFYYTRTTEGLDAIGTVDITTGQKKWSYPLKFQELIEGVFAAGGNRLYANIRNPVQMTSKMYAFDTSTGTVLWTFDLDSSLPIYGAPVYKDEKLYFETKPATTRNIWALDAASGKTLWKYSPTGMFTQPLSVTDESLIVLDEINIMAIDKNTGVQKWKTMYAEQFVAGGLQTIRGSSGMVVASDRIILGNYNKIKFFNSATGQLIYSTLQLTPTTGASGLRPIGVIKDTIFVTETNQFLYTYAVPKPSQLDTEKPTATIDLPAVSQLSMQDGKNQIKIPVTISETADMDVTIVDESGQVIQTIGWGRHLKGTSNFYWDGKNSRGFNVIRGNYYPIVKLTDLAGNKNEYTVRDKIIQITEGFGLTIKNANLRSAATTQSTILRTIPAGSEVVITGETGDWYQIEYRIISAVLKGYVSKPLIKVPSNQEIQAIESAKTRTNVNVRTYPGTQYDTKIVLPMNTDIKIYSAIGDWYSIEYKKDSVTLDSGYVAKFTITLPTVSTYVYTVIAGDSLWKIAQKNGVTIDSIVKANNLDPNQPIYIGQKLTIVK